MNENKLTQIAASIIDEFEEVLEYNDITIPDKHRDSDCDDESKIYGSTYYKLEDAIKKILSNIL